MEITFVFGMIASVVLAVSFLFYVVDIFRGKTQPHIYTWLIWSITQCTALAALLYGNGGFAAGIGIASSVLLTLFIFMLSFKYGTKNITRSDTVTLIAALLAVFVWWQLDNPLIAVAMVAIIDAVGYLPTYRKTWNEPYSEALQFWYLFTLGNLLALAAVQDYNLLTGTYLVTVIIASVILIILVYARRRAHMV